MTTNHTATPHHQQGSKKTLAFAPHAYPGGKKTWVAKVLATIGKTAHANHHNL